MAPPVLNWTKCNINGASQGNPSTSASGGTFRDHNADFLYCFSEPLGIRSSYYAELCAFVRATEIAKQKNWNNIIEFKYPSKSSNPYYFEQVL